MDTRSICSILWAAWILIWVCWALQSKKTQHSESFASRMSYTAVSWLAIYCIFFGNYLGHWWHSNIFVYRLWIGWVGVAIAVVGFAITFWARFTLGGNWSSNVTIKVEHELIRKGPYRCVRHPIYTGLMIAMAGTSIVFNQWRFLPATFFIWLSFHIKLLKEEKFMRQTFGEGYTEYSRTTGAIFPRLLRR